jgi:hypothetical protein
VPLLVGEVPFRDAFCLAVFEGGVGGDGVDSPMDEHAEFRFPPPLRAFGELFGGFLQSAGLFGKRLSTSGLSPRRRASLAADRSFRAA